MIFGRVAGTVVSNTKNDNFQGAKYLLIEKCSHNGQPKNDFFVALDMVSAGPGELVLLCQGSAAQQTLVTTKKPMDAIVVAIVDLIDENGKIVFQKK
ncbi:MAG: EutN/CcmL family microcompartment protein [Spirochaetes bacterium]|nr:EutN/CcmL family microcompartment protein [Spirochaetota bacterium]